MSQTLYLFRAGRLRRQQNTLLFEDRQGEKRFIPVAEVRDLYAMAPLRLNIQTLRFLGQKGIPLHVFTHYGTYAGTYQPRARQVSGDLVIAQVLHRENLAQRLSIAREFVSGAIHHMRKNLLYYHHRVQDFSEAIERLESIAQSLQTASSIPDLMGLEGQAYQVYFAQWQAILKLPAPFVRMRQPPTTLANALLSFLNTLLYTHCLSELYHTPLHPGISFLHEPRHRRFSLALDLSEPFRPLLTDRLLFRLLNRQEITEADLEPLGNLPGVFLKESARKSVVRAFADLMSTTIQHRRLKRSVSYRTLLRLEAYKLMRHLLQIESYRALRAWW